MTTAANANSKGRRRPTTRAGRAQPPSPTPRAPGPGEHARLVGALGDQRLRPVDGGRRPTQRLPAVQTGGMICAVAHVHAVRSQALHTSEFRRDVKPIRLTQLQQTIKIVSVRELDIPWMQAQPSAPSRRPAGNGTRGSNRQRLAQAAAISLRTHRRARAPSSNSGRSAEPDIRQPGVGPQRAPSGSSSREPRATLPLPARSRQRRQRTAQGRAASYEDEPTPRPGRPPMARRPGSRDRFRVPRLRAHGSRTGSPAPVAPQQTGGGPPRL